MAYAPASASGFAITQQKFLHGQDKYLAGVDTSAGENISALLYRLFTGKAPGSEIVNQVVQVAKDEKVVDTPLGRYLIDKDGNPTFLSPSPQATPATAMRTLGFTFNPQTNTRTQYVADQVLGTPAVDVGGITLPAMEIASAGKWTAPLAAAGMKAKRFKAHKGKKGKRSRY